MIEQAAERCREKLLESLSDIPVFLNAFGRIDAAISSGRKGEAKKHYRTMKRIYAEVADVYMIRLLNYVKERYPCLEEDKKVKTRTGDTRIKITYPVRRIPPVPGAVRDMPFSSKYPGVR
jgi:hypothetical protein